MKSHEVKMIRRWEWGINITLVIVAVLIIAGMW